MLGLGGRHLDSKGQSSSVDTAESRRFDNTLFSALDALDEEHVAYALIGGIAASGLGRPRPTQDIDIFLRPEDAEAALDVLAKAGFQTERTNTTWLFKAFKEGVLVDIVFRSLGGIYFDDEMKNRAVFARFHGRSVRLVSPEDFIIIKCAVHTEEGPHHWHDALAVLSQAKLDWDYLIHRSRKAPRRLLALLIYAQSSDIWIPNHPIQMLYQTIFDGKPMPQSPARRLQESASPQPAKRTEDSTRNVPTNTYLLAQIREALTQDDAVGATDIEVIVENNHILMRGQCLSEDQRSSVLKTCKNLSPGYTIDDQLTVAAWESPKEVEELS